MRIIQPKDSNITSNGSLQLKWNRDFGIRTEERFKRAQKFIDSECMRLMVPYTPRRNGFLEQSVKLGTVIGSGELRYLSPYARYLYYGEVYGPNFPIFEKGQTQPVAYFSPKGMSKHPTGKKLKFDKSRHKMAGPFWFNRMKEDHKHGILAGAAKAAGGKVG